MNKVILMGRLVRDPEVRYSQGNEPLAVARYTLAVNRRFRRQGEQDADFIGCVAFGKAGEFIHIIITSFLFIFIGDYCHPGVASVIRTSPESVKFCGFSTLRF